MVALFPPTNRLHSELPGVCKPYLERFYLPPSSFSKNLQGGSHPRIARKNATGSWLICTPRAIEAILWCSLSLKRLEKRRGLLLSRKKSATWAVRSQDVEAGSSRCQCTGLAAISRWQRYVLLFCLHLQHGWHGEPCT